MSKEVVMFVLDECPYCKEAFKIMDGLTAENPQYGSVKVEVIEETKDPARSSEYDYYYVPTYFVDGKKIHEGIPSEESIERVYQLAVK